MATQTTQEVKAFDMNDFFAAVGTVQLPMTLGQHDVTIVDFEGISAEKIRLVVLFEDGTEHRIYQTPGQFRFNLGAISRQLGLREPNPAIAWAAIKGQTVQGWVIDKPDAAGTVWRNLEFIPQQETAPVSKIKSSKL